MKYFIKECQSFIIFSFAISLLSCYDWDYLVFTQEWPESACIDANRTGHTCVIPSVVSTWTIHGLWPTKGISYGPSFCNESWHFDESKIKSLEPQLDQYWPNLYKDSKFTSFWKHEWEKHGTCCTDLAATKDEYHYFSTGLSLNQRLNISQVLAEQQILPGQSYKLADIEAVLQTEYQTSPLVQCNHKDGAQYLNSVEICLSKDLSVIKCQHRSVTKRLRHAMHQGGDRSVVWEMSKGGVNAEMCSTHHPVIYPAITSM